MASLASINIKFTADLKEFSGQMKNAERQLQQTGKKLQSAGTTLSLAVTAPFAALSAISLSNFDKQAKAVAQVEEGLRSTGNAAGYTSEQLQKVATDLQNTTLFGDEEILKDATAQLLTFTNIAGEQFTRTQEAALDLATRLDGDLKSASIQLGKALNDPIANLSALSRSGIQFSKEQKATIDALVKTNRLAEAQTLILDELEKQYGGSAAAAAKAGTGPLKQLQNSLGDLTEDFGMLIVEAITPFVEKAKEWVAGFQNLDIGTKKVILVVSAFAAALGPVIVVVGTLIRNISTIIPLIRALTVAIAANPIGAFAVAVTALAGGLLLANSRLTPLTNATREFNDLTAKATQSVAKEVAEVEKYIAIAKNDKLAKEDREKAIKALNAISPKYLGDLTLEKINTDEATKATNAYTAALLQKAKIQAAEEKLVEVQKKLLDLQLGSNDAVKPSLWQNLSNSMLAVGNNAVVASRTVGSISENLNTEKTELEKLQAQLISFIGTNDLAAQSNNEFADTLKKIASTGTIKELKQYLNSDVDIIRSAAEQRKVELEKLINYKPDVKTLTFEQRLQIDLDNSDLEKLNQDIQNVYNDETFKLTVAVDEAGVAFTENRISDLYDSVVGGALSTQEQLKGITSNIATSLVFFDPSATIENINSMIDTLGVGVDSVEDETERTASAMQRLAEVGEAVGGAVAGAFDDLSNSLVGSLKLADSGFQGFIKSLVGTITKLIAMMLASSISQAISGATASGTATGPGAVFATPAFIATAVGGVLAAFAAIPKFESGGVVGGSSYYGDRILARVNSGELILNQKQQQNLYNQLSNVSDTNVVLGGRLAISGDELQLVLDRANNRRNRRS